LASVIKHAWSNDSERKKLNIAGAIFVFTGLFLLVLGAVFLIAYSDHEAFHNQLLDCYNGNHCKAVEGVVEHFLPYVPHVHGEMFTVNNYKFEYGNYDASNPRFHTTREKGGPIKNGLHAKVWFANRDELGKYFDTHLNNMIVRLDIAE